MVEAIATRLEAIATSSFWHYYYSNKGIATRSSALKEESRRPETPTSVVRASVVAELHSEWVVINPH